MALTRIKTNQLTDLAVTNPKIANATIEGGKLANNITYGSDFTVSGNLTVSGTTTSVSTTNTRVDDAILALANGTSGAPSEDAGLLINRGSSDNQAFIWDESEDKFVFANVGAEDGDTAGNLTIASYAPVQMAALASTSIDASGVVTITDSTAASNASTGALIITGGVGVGGAVHATGGFDGDLTGNADTATALETARAIAIAGDVVGTANFDGTGDISITATIQADSVALGTDTTGNYVQSLADAGNSFFTITNGTAEGGAATIDLVAGSVTLGTHTSGNYTATITGGNGIASTGATSGEGIAHSLSVDLTDTTTFASDGTASRAVVLDGSGDFSANMITSDLTGNVTGTADVATSITATANDATNESVFITFVDGQTGSQGIETDVGLVYNPSTGALTSTSFVGSLTGTADDADALSSAVTVALTGDVTGSATFTSAGDTASISTTIAANSVALGADTTGNYVATITGGNGIASTGATSGETIAHSLSVDLTDTNIFASDGTVSRAVVLDGSGDFSAGTITAAIDGIVGGNTPAAVTATTIAANTSATLASAAVSDLTSGRVVLAGTSGELEDSASLTFNGSTLAVNGAVTVGTTLDVTGTTSLDGAVNLGDAAGDAISIIGTATFTPSADFDGGFTVAGSQTIDMGANVVTNVADPTADQHAATKAYVDAEISSGGGTLTIGDGSTTDGVVVGADTLVFAGTANEITTTVTNNQVQVGLASDVTVSNDLTVAGNLTVQGTTTTLSTTNSVVSDSLIELNSGAGSNANDLGLIFERGSTGDNAVFAWDESADKFTLGTTTATGTSTGDLTIAAGTLVASLEGNADTATALETARNIAIAGDVVGTASFDGTGDISISATIQADSVALGTDTTGNYVQSIADAGSSQFTITNGTAEGGAATIALANNAVTLGTHTAGNYVATLADAGNNFFTIANSGSESAAVTIDLVAGSVTLGTHTSGDFVGTITGGAGIASTGATTGEDTDHSLSVDLTDTSVFNSDGTVSTAVVLDGSGNFSANMITSDLTGDVTGTADVATSITAVANNATNESVFLTFVDGATGTQGIETDTGLTYNPSTNVLTTTTFSGALSGNADTATTAAALTTARAIEVSGAVTGTANFDGSEAINIVTTATADPTITLAGDLTGSVTLTNLGDGTLTATIAANSVALGTDTTGNYVADITGGAGIASTGATTGEGIAHSLSVDLTDTNIFASDGTASRAVVMDASSNFSAGTITAAIDGIIGGNTPAAGTFTTLAANTSATLASAAVSDLTSGRVVLAGTSGELEDSANLAFNGSTLAVTGAITASGNIDIADAGSLRVGTGNDFTINHDGTDTTIANGTGILAIDGTATSAIRVNEAGADVDFIVEGDSATSLFVVDAGNDNVGIGGAANANAIFHVNDTGAMILAAGTTAQRPGSAVTGMFRYNTTSNSIEYYDNSGWQGVSSDFTVATSQTFNGDDTTTDFTLSALTGADSYTVAGVLVMLNGVVQEPTTVYGISGTTLSFTTAPATGDLIEVRKFTTTTTVVALSDFDGDTQVQVEETSDDDTIRFDIQGVEKAYLNSTGLMVAGNIHATGAITADGDITLGDESSDTVTFTAKVGSDIVPTADSTYDLGSDPDSSGFAWANVWADTYYGDGSNLTGVTDAAALPKAGGTMSGAIAMGTNAITGMADPSSAQDAATKAYVDSQVSSVPTGDITNVSVSGTGLSGGGASGSVTITSNATSANTANTIVARDGSGNFSAGVITGTSTAARYADLAEMYAADGDIAPGTVVHFAGDGKVAACDVANCRAVAGIISTDPAHLMNSAQEGVALALAGRVPTKVTGPVAAGDLMVSAGNGMAMANNEAAMGTVIGKAIEANEGGEGVIEVLALMM